MKRAVERLERADETEEGRGPSSGGGLPPLQHGDADVDTELLNLALEEKLGDPVEGQAMSSMMALA